MEWIVVKTLFSLAAVLALMVAVVYVLRKYVYQGTGGGSASAAVSVEVLGQRALHPKRSVMVLKVMHKVLVVGMSEQGMQTLATIDDEESMAEIDARLNMKLPESRWMMLRGGEGSRSFAGQLQESIKSFLTHRSEDGAGQEQAPAAEAPIPASPFLKPEAPAPAGPKARTARKPRRQV